MSLKTTVSAFVLLAVVSGCSSPPKVQTPTGDNRKPINNPQAISELQLRQRNEDFELKRRTELELTVDALKRQVTELKNYILLKAAETEINTPKGATTPASTSIKNEPPRNQEVLEKKTSANDLPKALVDGREFIIVNSDKSVTFHVTHPVAQTAFNTTDDMKNKILAAARVSEKIEVRGRTDSTSFNAYDRDIALNRAVRAYGFLVKNGIPASKIKVTYQTSGNFIVDNSTPDGKARNRRVEIETIGVNTAYFQG